jgi:hypothetical protein
VARKDAATKKALNKMRVEAKESLAATPRTESYEGIGDVVFPGKEDAVTDDTFDINPPDYNPELPPENEVPAWTPDSEDFITLKGKSYLPARRRIQWMRGGTPKAHPEWGIETEVLQFERGERLGMGKVKGGYACVKASVIDHSGTYRLIIATGMKTEWSENFADFLEKAETGAIARALAVAGYGTETALDLDEGAEAGRIADAPVEPKAPISTPHFTRQQSETAPVITPSTASPAAHGGRMTVASDVQVSEVFRLARESHMTLRGLVSKTTELLGISGPDLDATSPDDAKEVVADWMEAMTPDEVGRVITQLRGIQPTRLSEDIHEFEATR